MQRGLNDRRAVSLPVRQNESSADILIPYERPVHLVFWHEEWLVGDVPFYLKFWAILTLPRFKNGYFQWIFTRSASAFTPSNRRSTTGFPMSLGLAAYVAPKPPKGAPKRKVSVFRIKVDFFRRKSVTKLLYVKTFSGKVVRHSLASICVQMAGGS